MQRHENSFKNQQRIITAIKLGCTINNQPKMLDQVTLQK